MGGRHFTRRASPAYVEEQLFALVTPVDLGAVGGDKDVKDIERLERRADMTRAAGPPMQVLCGDSAFAACESLDVPHSVQIHDVEVARFRFHT